MKYLKIMATLLFVGLCFLAYVYINTMVSYKCEIDLMKTHVELSSSSSEEKNNTLEQINIKEQNILRTKRVVVILFYLCLLGLVTIVYFLYSFGRSKNKHQVSVPDMLTEENKYYAFGMNHLNQSEKSVYAPLSVPYNYKYNGKEMQETGMYDYGWRHYMPDIGRWNGIDQLAEKYHSISPYAYVANNPISFIDPDGRRVVETADGWTFTGSDIQGALNIKLGAKW